MRTLRATSLVLAFLAATGLVLGSFAFSAMSADRGLDVGVVGDDEAYVGYEDVSDGEIHPTEETPIARYHNRFMLGLDDFRVDVRVIEGTADVDVDDQPDGLDAGDGAYVNVTVHDCQLGEEITLALDAEGSGAGVSVSFTREVTVECVAKEPQIVGVTFNDAANAQFDFETDDGPGASSGAAGTETAEAVVWQKPTPPNEESDASDLEAERTDISPNDPNLRNVLAAESDDDDEDGEDWKVVAIEFPNQHVAFFHPGWDAGAFESVASSEGVEVETDDDLTAGDVIDRSFVDEETADDD